MVPSGITHPRTINPLIVISGRIIDYVALPESGKIKGEKWFGDEMPGMFNCVVVDERLQWKGKRLSREKREKDYVCSMWRAVEYLEVFLHKCLNMVHWFWISLTAALILTPLRLQRLMKMPLRLFSAAAVSWTIISMMFPAGAQSRLLRQWAELCCQCNRKKTVLRSNIVTVLNMFTLTAAVHWRHFSASLFTFMSGNRKMDSHHPSWKAWTHLKSLRIFLFFFSFGDWLTPFCLLVEVFNGL